MGVYYADGLYHYMGSDAPEKSDGRPKNNKFTNNSILNTKNGVKLKRCDDTTVSGEIHLILWWYGG